MTNLEYWLGTPEKAADVIRACQLWSNDSRFEAAWLCWYIDRWIDTDPDDMPSTTECMAEFLRAEHK